MKIAVASDDTINLALHFGRTKGFILFDTDNGKILSREYLINTFTGHANGHHHAENKDHHHSHHGVMQALKDCSVIISHGMGHRMLIDLENAGKEVYIATATSAEAAVILYLEGNLEHDPNKSCQHEKGSF